MTSNPKAVPERSYGYLGDVSTAILVIMRDETAAEMELLRTDVRHLGAKRNGLAHIERELRLRGY